MLVNSLAKQNFSRASEDAVNQQIQLYRMAQQTYLAASAYFDQSGIALPVTKFSSTCVCFSNQTTGICKIFS